MIGSSKTECLLFSEEETRETHHKETEKFYESRNIGNEWTAEAEKHQVPSKTEFTKIVYQSSEEISGGIHIKKDSGLTLETFEEQTPESKNVQKEETGKRFSLVCEESPRFLLCLQDKTISEGEELRLKCIVGGWPSPDVTWTLNNETLKESEESAF